MGVWHFGEPVCSAHQRDMNSTHVGANPLNKIIGLSIILSMGFLLVVLAGVYGNWFPIVIGVIFAFAHVPIVVASAYSDNGDYDFNFDPESSSLGNAFKEIGSFISSLFLTSGFSLPILLHHSRILTTTAMVLTIVGGTLIYGTVYTFSLYFGDADSDDLELPSGVI